MEVFRGSFPAGFAFLGGRPPELLGSGNGRMNSKVRPEVRPTARRGGLCGAGESEWGEINGLSPLPPGSAAVERLGLTPALVHPRLGGGTILFDLLFGPAYEFSVGCVVAGLPLAALVFLALRDRRKRKML